MSVSQDPGLLGTLRLGRGRRGARDPAVPPGMGGRLRRNRHAPSAKVGRRHRHPNASCALADPVLDMGHGHP